MLMMSQGLWQVEAQSKYLLRNDIQSQKLFAVSVSNNYYLSYSAFFVFYQETYEVREHISRLWGLEMLTEGY